MRRTDGAAASTWRRVVSASVLAALLGAALVPFGFAAPAAAANGDVSGTVFNDYNHDGLQTAASGAGVTAVLGDPGVAGVWVRAYDAAGAAVGSAVQTSATGTYTLALGASSGTPVRIEFETPAGYESSRAPLATMTTANNSSVRFMNIPATTATANYAIERPGEFCKNNPTLCSSIFPWDTASGLGQTLTDLSDTGLISFLYPETLNDTAPAPTVVEAGTETGPIYGIAYDRVAQNTFSSSFLHRKSPFISTLSANQTGLIFKTTNAGVTTVWANLNTLFANTPGGANPHPWGGAVPASYWLNDSASAALIGQRGLGDLDISPDGRFLYSVGLNDKKVYRLSSITAPATAADVDVYPVPTPASCTNAADVQPFGLGVKGDGTVYVGAVCSGQLGGAGALRYYVWTLSSAGVYSLVLDVAVPNFNISVNKVGGVTPVPAAAPTAPRWNAWGFSNTWTDGTRDFSSTANYALGGQEVHPQPMLTDIEFDGDNLVLGIRDRYGDQAYGASKRFDQEPYAHGQGDVVRVCNVSGAFVLEGAAGCTNGGEWFGNDIPSDGWHESSMGAVLSLSVEPGVVTTAYDPLAYNPGRVNSLFNEMGVENLQKTATTVATAHLGAYAADILGSDLSKAWGKTNGMGDLEALCDSAPLEIGNRVWNDTDRDGIQDAGEAGIANVTVGLYNAAGSGSAISTAVTNSAGEYYFTTETARAAVSLTDDVGGGLVFRTGYTLRFGTAANYGAGQPLSGLVPSTADQTVTETFVGRSDTLDSDATLVDTVVGGANTLGSDIFPVITVDSTTTNPGENAHTYDVGFNVPIVYTAVDLALTKVVTSRSGNLSSGTGTVTFTISVINQGAVSVNPVVVTDYINTAHFNALASTQAVTTSQGGAIWSAGATPSITLPAALAAGATATIPITLSVATLGATNPAALTNRAEITSFDNDNNAVNGNSANGQVYDVDSVADNTPSNDGTEKDDVVNEARYVNTGGVTGSPSAALDEDDADIASVPLIAVDLALRKVVTSQSGVLGAGGTVTFTITVFNQGSVSVNPAVVTDYINTAHFNALASTQAVTTSLGAATWSSGATPTLTLPAALAPGANATIPITLTVASLGATNPAALTNRAEISAFDTDNTASNGNSSTGWVYDVDSVSDATPGNDGNEKDDFITEARYVNTAGTIGTPSATLDEDDADIASVPLTGVDLALTKVVTSRTGSLFSGGTVTFTISVINQGAVSVNPVTVTDYINTAHFGALAGTQAVTTSLGAATWSAGATPSITLPAALAAGATATIPITLTVAALGATNPAALTNRAEISAFDTDNNAGNGNSADGTVFDVDSVADATPGNEGTEKDDVVNEARYVNTAGTTGTPSATLDEDDADIASVPLIAVDLALRKVVTSQTGNVSLGTGTVTFTITVTNQGSVSVNPIVVSDYINTAHFNALASTQAVTTSLGAATWSTGATPTITVPAALAPGASVTIPITLTVANLGATNPAALTNRAEISSFDSDNNAANGNSSNGWVYDVDSVADATPSNDGNEKDDVINEARYVNTAGTNGTPSATLDEDDADIASVPLTGVDLALTKVVTSRTNLSSGSGTVTFTITVINQGAVSVNPVVVTDYINTAHFNALASTQAVTTSLGAATWSAGATPTITLPAALGAGLSATIPITLSVAALGATNPAALTNRAEISSFDTDNNAANGNSTDGTVYDVDSVADATPSNDGTEKDDVVNEARYVNTAGTTGTPSATLDEDDADIASVPLTAVDLALRKVVTSRSGSVFSGGTVTFTITVFNQGSVSVNPVVVTDYINTAHFNALASTQAVSTSLGAATWSAGATPSITLPAALAAGSSATIPITLTVATLGATNPAALTNRAEITSFDTDNLASNGNSADGAVFDVDSVADATPSNDGTEKDDFITEARYVNTGGVTGSPSATLDEDDADIASVPLSAVDLALTKVVTSRSGSVYGGGTVTFTITVTNQGSVSVNPVNVTDYINTAHFNALASTQAVTTSLGAATWSAGATPGIILPAALAPGASATIPITLTVATLGATNPAALTNRAEISGFDTDNDATNGNSSNGWVYDVDSIADATPSNDGTEKDDVTNEARYVNTAGTNGTPSATLDEDDADIASVPLSAVDLALTKVVTSRSGNISSGGTVTFTITVTNQGSVAVNPVVVTDYINTAHFDALASTQLVAISGGPSNATWSSGATPSITLPSALAPGASATIPITLTVANLGATNPVALTNRAEISAFDTDNTAANGNSSNGWVYDIDSVPDTNAGNEGTEKDDVTNEARYVNTAGTIGTPSATLDEDDADIASVPLTAVDLALTKVVTSRTAISSGSGSVTFTITVTNQGSVSANPIVVTDYINTAHFNALASTQAVTTSLGAATWSAGATPSITLPAALASGASATIPITLSVANLGATNPAALTNRAEITSFDSDNNAANGNSADGSVFDIDSVADANPSNEGNEKDDVTNEARYVNTAGTTGTPSATLDEDDADVASVPLSGVDLALTKVVTSRTGSLFSGGTVTFTISVINQGAVSVNPVVVTDYINTAHFNALASSQAVTTSLGAATWSAGATPSITLPAALAVGATATIPITLTVASLGATNPAALTNRAEISSFDTDNNAANGNSADGTVFDVDSVADATPSNEGTEKDDVVNEARYVNTGGVTGTPSATLDEDDADIASVPLIAVDLALRKVVTSRSGSVYGGGTVTFTITVTNQGSVSVNPAVVTDYINTAHFNALASTQAVTTSLGAATWSSGATPAITLPAALAPGASATIPITLTVATLGATNPAALTNRAEISSFDNDNNAANGDSSNGWVYDVDSIADATPSNDGTEKDDVTNEARYVNTAGTNGTPSALLDEDDADIASVPLIAVDLALTKVYTSTGGLLVNGNGTVTFTITVTNQGSVSANPVVVTDYINTADFSALASPQLVFISGGPSNATWSSGATPSITLPAALAPGASVTIPITLAVAPGAVVNPLTAASLTNRAEISSFDSDNDATNGNSSTGWVYDVDSVPDTNPANEGTEKDDVTNEARYVNTSGTIGTPSATLDEDDADLATVPLYDLALIKDLAGSETGYVQGPLPDSVGFDITVTNQGLNTNYNVRVQDRPEADMTLVPAANSSQSVTSSLSNTRTVTYGGSDYWDINQLLPNESVTFRVYVNAVTNGTSPYVNVAEITGFDNDANPLNVVPSYVQDVDSTPANNITPEDDQDNAQVIARPLVIGSTLFLDTDKDGVADVRAPAGILVQLLDSTDTVIDSAVTDAGGNYFFDGLSEASYSVGIPTTQSGPGVNPAALTGYVSVPGFSITPSAGNTLEGGSNDDGQVATGWLARSTPFTMTYEGHAGSDPIDLANAVTYLGTPVADETASLNIDFIFQPLPTYRVGNLVWLDTNNNGLVDGFETGIDGVTVQLYTSANVLVATTTTAGGGHYEFDSLAAGDYYVQIPAIEFTSGGPLFGWRASSGAGVEADPDTDVDNNSNATQASPTALAKTANVTLGSTTDPLDASEPINETDSDTWTDGNNRSNLSVDLGFYHLYRIGSTLFLDTDKDGDADTRAGAGILVQLLNAIGVVIDSAVTDAGGNYFFDNVTPSLYEVGVPTLQAGPGVNPAALTGYVSVPGFSAAPETANTLEGVGVDDGSVSAGWLARSAGFLMNYSGNGGNAPIDLTNAGIYLGTTVLDATANLNIDFIFQPAPTYRVGNLVWFDTNNNGLVDGAETGIDGVTVELYTSADVLVGSVVTSSGGHYEFGPLVAGDYYVQIPATQFASGGPLFGLSASSGLGFEADPDSDVDNNSNAIQVTSTTRAFTANVTLGSPTDPFDASEPINETDSDTWTDGNDRSNLSVDLGFHEPLRIGSTLFLDTDKDGDADVRAPAGIRVALLDNAGSVIATAITDAGGNYFFDGLVSGLYQVGVPVNQTGPGLNPAALSGYYSVPGASPAPSALNTLEGDTDDDGASDIGNGWRAITAQFSMNYGAHAGNAVTDLGNAAIYLGTPRADMNSELDIDFIFQPVPTYRVGNLVWLDRNNNGVVDGTEAGIDGVTVELLSATDTLLATTVTSGGGHYVFDTLAAGDYYVRIPSAEFISSGDLIGLRASTGAGVEADPDSDVDNNSNATQSGPIAFAATAVFTLGSTTDPFDANEPINETDSDTWTDGNNRSNLSVDLGFYEPLRIGSTLFFDTDEEGIADLRAGGGVLVQLLDGAGVVIASAVTDAAGNYYFGDLAPGTFQVAIPTTQTGPGVNPAALTGYISVPGASLAPKATNTMVGDAGDDGALDLGNGWKAITAQFTMSYTGNGGNNATDLYFAVPYLGTPVSDASANLNIDFIFQPLPTYRVGNLVWLDANNNGLVDGAETGVDGVAVELYTSLDVLVASTVTSGGGHYVFDTLPAGVYYVQIPATEFSGPLLGLRASTGAGVEANPDLDVDNNSNATQASPTALAKTGNFTLGSLTDPLDASEPTDETDSDTWTYGDDRSNLSIDLGFYEPLRVGSLVWNDNGWDGFTTYTLANDNNGVADFGEFGIYGVNVELWTDVDLDGAFEPAGDDFTGFVATTTTDTAGTYLFDDLAAGSYFIAIPAGQAPLSPLRSSTPDTNGGSPEFADDDDDGIPATSGYVVRSGVVVLAYGAEPSTETGDFGFGDSEARADALTGSTKADTSSQLFVDFGFSPSPLYRIGNVIWRDYDDDGSLDVGEPGLSGLTVELYEDNGSTPFVWDGTDSLLGSTTTDVDGLYGFDNLAGGNYLVHVPSQSALANWRTAGTIVANANGNVDNDNNALVDATDGWTSGRVVLGGPGGPADHAEPTGETDANTGNSAEDGLWRDDRSNQTVDFGFYAGLRLGNQVWLDEGAGSNRANGVFDSDESGLTGITVQLWLDDGDNVFTASSDALVTSTTTDGEGNYLFSHLDEGDYFVAVPVTGSPVMVSSPGTIGTGLTDDNRDDGAPTTSYLAVTGLLPLTIGGAEYGEQDAAPLGDDFAEDEANAAGDTYRDQDSYLTADLGFTDVATYRIGNRVWADWDNDGDAEGGEPGIPGVLVQLRDGSGLVIADTVTDWNGFYEFTNLVAGDYGIYIPVVQSGVGVDPAALTGFISASVTESDADANADNDDNGVDDVLGSTLIGWASGVVTLGDGTSDEPTDETYRSDDAFDDDIGQSIPRIDDDYSNYSVDFGFYSISVGNHVWLDVTNNDVFDSGTDLPAAGVTVQLRNAATNAILQTTTTDVDGQYLFIGLTDGSDYRVVIPAVNFASGGPLEGWYQAPGSASGFAVADGRDRGVDGPINVDVVSEDFTTDAGSMPLGENSIEDVLNDSVRADGNTNLFVDFSFNNWTPTYRVGNLVWRDGNNNGVVDGTETGIDGVTVDLYDSADVYFGTTITSGGGHYEFDTLAPGDYYVQIPATEFTSGALQGLRASSNGVEADPDSDVDNNSNAIQVTPTAVAYTAHFTLGSLTDPFDTNEPTNETDLDVWIDGDNRSNLSVDLGFYQPLRVGSLVWYDDGFDGVSAYTLSNDDNGNADSGELGVSGLTVQLWRDVDHDGLFEPTPGDDAAGFVGDTVTDPAGSYLFGGLAPDDYFVAIPAGQAPLSGWRSSSPDSNAGLPEATDDDDDGIVAPGYAGATGQIVLDYETEPTNETGDFGFGNSETLADTIGGATANNNSQLFVDFGFSPMPTYRVANLVWNDYNDNGVADSGEPGLDGLTVELYRVGTLAAIATTTTAGGGRYEFSGLPAGDYRVHVPTQTAIAGWRTAGTPEANADGNVDNDNNAVVDGATGWTSGVVTLGGAAGPADHAEPTGEVDGTDGASAEDGAERDDRSNQTIDFGFFSGLRLGNQVWFDDGAGANLDNGIFDSDESGLAGVAVQLWLDDGDSTFDTASDSLVASTSTNVEGNYWFGHLEPGDYFVALPTFSGALSSTGTVGVGLADDNVDDGAPTAGYVAVSGLLTLTIGAAVAGEADVSPAGDGSAEAEADSATSGYRDVDSFLTADFGLTGVPLYRLGNRVWVDSNNDGVATSSEPGVSGVLVQLRNSSNVLVAETVTDAAGFYAFSGLVEGDYSVFIPLDQLVDGTLPIGSPAIVPAALNGYLSSTATVINANTDADNDDNGIDQFTGPALVGWSSGLVTLSGTASEPTNETLRSNDATDDDLGQLAPRIDDNRSNYTVDFGFYSISVGNHLWLDLANDGEYDAGTDLPAVGVTVELRNSASNALITTATTDASGLYLLTGVPDDASYVVVIPGDNFDVGGPLEGWYPSNGSQSGFATDGRDRGLNAAHFADVLSNAFPVNAGSMPLGENGTDDLLNDSVRPDANTNLYLDFSFYRMELGGVLFWDPSNNGVDDLDGHFPNVTLLLYNGDGTPFLRADGVQATTSTDTSGHYVFVGLPTGTFIVEIPASEFTQELDSLGSSDGNNVAGVAPPADSDDLLADNGNPVSGNLFDGSAVRSSVITLSIDNELTTDTPPTAGVPNADSNLAVDFGFWMVQAGLELGNQIWFDTDKDGVYDVGTELPAPAGVIVELHDWVTGALISTVTTNALGQYLFAGLVAGTYYLELPTINFVGGHPLSGYIATTGAGVSSTPTDGLDLDSNGETVGAIGAAGIRTGMVSLVAQLPTLEVDGFITVNDDRLSDLTVDFGLVQLDTLAFTGADLEHPATLAFWLIVLGLLLMLFTRYSRKRNQSNKPLPM